MRDKPEQNPVPSSVQQQLLEGEEPRFCPTGVAHGAGETDTHTTPPPPGSGGSPPGDPRRYHQPGQSHGHDVEAKGPAPSAANRPAEEFKPAQPSWRRAAESRRGPGNRPGAPSAAGCGTPPPASPQQTRSRPGPPTAGGRGLGRALLGGRRRAALPLPAAIPQAVGGHAWGGGSASPLTPPPPLPDGGRFLLRRLTARLNISGCPEPEGAAAPSPLPSVPPRSTPLSP